MTAPSQLILHLSAEGGGVALYGTAIGEGWVFRRRVADQTPLLLDESGTEHESESVESWDAAIRLLDRYPWHRFTPRAVHPDFRELVWREVLRRHELDPLEEFQLDEWRTVCLTTGHKFSEGTFEVIGEVSAAELEELKKLTKSVEGQKP